jgi:hypothetical protein
MSVTSIQFIGLFVVMMNTGAGLHILLPHFPDTPYANHVSVVQFTPEQVLSTTWPGIITCGPNGTLQCAPIAVETITFSGADDPSPTDIIGNMPHLSCCCASMTDILPKYKDPTASGKLSAHIFVTRGVAEAITGGNGRTDTWVTMHTADPVGITVTGIPITGAPFNIIFKPGAQFTILNSIPPFPDEPNHFLAYYLMGVASTNCTAVPSDGPPCAASASDCVIPKVLANKRRSKIAKSIASRGTLHGPLHPKRLEVDSDCANSHFP